ncbi:Acetyltransferase (GNAT) family protein [Kaistia soli DSM 19436]|uniref:Acetyltransferase (GNAT) family protein n=1 Tax=Kaistia soli DSM 19436 TaxID=1122133 RepID=A0A1M5A0A7_9HYPH|nr:GNAT family N-acetyltransferase [Kaistia soli]SHF23740.1 Acetyltransferase (GNAT) family protein [Kaistia soli DSM 19436]
MTAVDIRTDPPLANANLAALWSAAWGNTGPADFQPMLTHSLVYLGAYDGTRLVGFVHVAFDGGVHAFLLDPTVHPDCRRTGLGTRLVTEAARLSAERGAEWLHVDYEPHLAGFYAGCGFRATEAGLLRLTP